jgi:hypothetical protein
MNERGAAKMLTANSMVCLKEAIEALASSEVVVRYARTLPVEEGRLHKDRESRSKRRAICRHSRQRTRSMKVKDLHFISLKCYGST